MLVFQHSHLIIVFFFVLIELYLFQQTLLIIFCQSNFSINIFYYLLVFLFST